MAKIKLIESYLIDFSKFKVDIDPTIKMVEDAKGTIKEGYYTLKNVPVTKFTENLNGRIYNRKLWENVQKSKMFEGSACYADHKEEYSVLDQLGVWSNFRVLDELGVADLTLVGNGKIIKEIAENKGKVGFSTVGYGELMEDDKTVDPSSYEYSNTDAVTNPSQGTFATFENIVESIQGNVSNSIINPNNKLIINEKQNNILENKNTNIINNVLEKNEVNNHMSEKFIEASLRMQVKQAIKEAEGSNKPVEAIKELQEVFKTVPAEMIDVKESVEQCISKLQEKIEADKVAIQKELKESKETFETLSKKYDVATETIKSLKEQIEKANEIVKNSVNPKIKESLSLMKRDLNQFAKDRILMEKDMKHLLEDIENMKSDLKVYEEDTILRDKDINKFKEERKALKEKNKNIKAKLDEAEKHIVELEKILSEDYGYEFDDDMIDDELIDDDFINTEDEYDPYVLDSMYDESEENEGDGLTGNDDIDDYMYVEAEDEDKDDEDKDEMEEAEDSDSDDEDEDDEKEDKKDDSKKESTKKVKKSESSKNVTVQYKTLKEVKLNPAVVSYYKEAVRKTPAIKDIKESILKSGSVMEAIKKVQGFERKFNNDVLNLKESKSSKSEQYERYVFKRF